MSSNSLEKVCAAVQKRITPSKQQREKIEALAKRLEKKVARACKEFGVKAKVRVEGSVAKDTWLGEEPDIDIFMRVPKSVPRNQLGEVCLKVARKATEGSEQVERFAEHPYLEAFVEKTRVNIVPCYDTKRGEWQSATDRTPFHTDYVNKRLTSKLRNEVRLLKRFMKGIGVYGAEIKIGGFSGYLCELLILHHKGFRSVLEAFTRHRHRTVIDIENHYKSREKELNLLFKEPLVVVDPVDKGRNVASAVQPHKLDTFVAASQSFLKNPKITFFYPPKTVPLTTEQLREKLANRHPALVFITFEKVEAVPDVLWGQLYKSQRSLTKLLLANDFNVIRDAAWSDEKTLNLFLFELEQHQIPPVKKHLGPPLDKEHECTKFLTKYQGNVSSAAGPYVENGRWVTQIQRRYTDARVLLREKLKDGGRNAGVAERISRVLRRKFSVLLNEEIEKTYAENKDFAEFLTDFLSGKPKWLETS
ncbi:MAG: CCA tRNA nucleotidyltransferase [Candidatus Bathyarchaeia archaeon]